MENRIDAIYARQSVDRKDSISRSILDFATMMELFQQYNVEFVSSTEKFETSTPPTASSWSPPPSRASARK